MRLNDLPKITVRRKKRVGRGHGSGRGGHSSGRGTSGQKARSKIPLTFEGTKMKKSLLKRLPLKRGKGKFKPLKPPLIVVNLKYLNLFKKEDLINLEALIKKGIVERRETGKFGVKILGDGELKVALKVDLPCSRKAAEKIKKAGGKIVYDKSS